MNKETKRRIRGIYQRMAAPERMALERALLMKKKDRFGLIARSDLLNVVQRETPLSQVLLQPMHGLRVLPAAKAVKK